MAGLFWHDGRWHETEPRVLGPMDHAFWLGSVVFDGARGIRGTVPDIDAHCARVVRSAASMQMRATLPAEEIAALCREAVRRMGPEAELYIRPMFFARKGLGTLLADPDSTEFLLAVYDSPMPPASGFGACLAPQRRPAPDQAPTDAKASCLYPNSARAAAFARARGFDNAVVCDLDGNLCEFASANLMLVKDGVVRTPVPNGTFLDGITRRRVIGLLRGAGIEVREEAIRPEALLDADEIFSTGNYGKVVPCTRYEARALQPGPVAREARRLYLAFAEESRILPARA